MSDKRTERKAIRQIDGMILFDKPQGPTSHDIVQIVREKLGFQRVGHAGTLDPSATGLLIILLGSYTKKQKDFQLLEKVYEGKIKLGIVTDTWDMAGKVLREVKDFKLNNSKIEAVISLMEGNIRQTVPPYSAAKYRGTTFYRLARKNKSVPLVKKSVKIRWLEWRYSADDNMIFFKIKCSSGTYIRSVAYEVGDMLGCGGTLYYLRRTEIGNYHVENAITVDEFEKLSLKELEKKIITMV